MTEDDIMSLSLDLHDFLLNVMKVQLDEDDDYGALSDFLMSKLDSFITRERNYN